MVENAGTGAAAQRPGWVEWAGLQQQLAGENACTFQAVMEQRLMTQTQASVKLWEAVAQTMEPRGKTKRCRQEHAPRPRRACTANSPNAIGPENDDCR